MNRDFESSEFGTKWLTDVTEMKYGNQNKAYLSAILDLSDKGIVSFVVGHSNNNELVFKTFDIAHMTYPDATPLFHSDRVSNIHKIFKKKLRRCRYNSKHVRGIRCIDNGPMESFWGMVKSEMYYLRKFYTYEELEAAVIEYIDYYNTRRYQKRLNCMTPLE
ncbi:IS3 family transposase [Paenibacillus larvae]|nr:IS3 family transposase [Paenibacillus larvae]MDT2236032.1 IS3 family transposase [Paenibacillus larvae]